MEQGNTDIALWKGLVRLFRRRVVWRLRRGMDRGSTNQELEKGWVKVWRLKKGEERVTLRKNMIQQRGGREKRVMNIGWGMCESGRGFKGGREKCGTDIVMGMSE